MKRLLKRLPIWLKLSPFYLAMAAGICVPLIADHNHALAVQKAAKAAQSHIIHTAKVTPISGHPIRIIIPRLAIDVAIVDGKYYPAVRQWSVAEHSANYATNTPLASNTAGSPLIYGHWFDDVFGKTKDLQAGDIAYVYTDNNHVFKYQFTGAVLMNPTDTTIFDGLATTKPGLKLMTCEGTWAQHRRIMSFNEVGVSA